MQEAAEAQTNLARAGFNTNEIMGAMPGLLDLAASSNLDLANASDYTANIIRTFGFEAEDAGRVADVLAKGASTANIDVSGLAGSMKTAGSIAKSVGIEFESVAGATGLMADAGLAGEEAGRMLRQGMLRLAKPTGEAGKLINQMGVEVFDANGNMKQLDEVVGELEKGMEGYTGQQKAAALATLFGSESTAGWSILLDEGSDTLRDYTQELKNSEGAAKEMADVMQDNAEGAITRMQSALSGLKIEMGEKLLPVIAEGADKIAELATSLSEMDAETISTVAEIALLVTAILGVTTVVGGLVAGIGAFMAFAGPVGLAITGGTLLLGGLAAAIYHNQKKTKALAEEQKIAEQEARRYGKGLSEGTLEGVRGYIDLYEGAKVKMLELRTMSGKEAEATKAEVVKAFSDMGDQVVAELQKFAEGFSETVKEIYGVYEDEGKKRANELNKQVQADVKELITNYESASARIGEIINEFGTDVESYPPKIKKAYEANLAIMEQGASEFASSYEDSLKLRNKLEENSNTLMLEEAQRWLNEINETHASSRKNIDEQYLAHLDVIEKVGAKYGKHSDVYQEMMKTLETSTYKAYAEVDNARAESTRLLYENTDTTGELLDLQTGKVMERLETEEFVSKGLVGSYEKRTESDEEYFMRYTKNSEEFLGALEGSISKSLDLIEQQAYEWRVAMGDSENEAKQFAKNIREGVITELEQGDEKAKEAGKKKGDKHKEGINSTKEDNKKSAKEVSDGTKDNLDTNEAGAKDAGRKKGKAHKDGVDSTKGDNNKSAKSLSDDANKNLNTNESGASGAGKKKGDAHRQGLNSTKGANSLSAQAISGSVSSLLGKTTDGGGGKRAGGFFSSGLSGTKTLAYMAARGVASRGDSGLRSVSTTGAGNDFVAGFRNSISAGRGIWSTAWNLGKSALRALKSSINSNSPSKETGKLGVDFTDGFHLAIANSKDKSIKSARSVGRESVEALNKEVNSFKQSFGAIALATETNKATLKVEHTLDKKFDEFSNMFRAYNETNNNQNALAKLLDATLQQNQLLMELLHKDNTAVVAFDSVYQPIKRRLDEDKYSRDKQRRRR